MKPRPRKPGLDLSLWDQRPSGESREWNADKSARAAMCASPHPEKMRKVLPGLAGVPLPFFAEASKGKPSKSFEEDKGSLALRVMGEIQSHPYDPPREK